MKQKLTDDQAEMLAFLATKGTFEQTDIYNFISHFAAWDEKHRLDVFLELDRLGLIQAQEVQYIPDEGKSILDKDFKMEVRVKGMYVPDDAKALLANHQDEKEKIKQREQLELNLKTSTVNANRLTVINICVGLALAIIVLSIQIMTFYRDERKELRELEQATTDSIREEKRLRHDSLYENYLLRKAEETATFFKSNTLKK